MICFADSLDAWTGELPAIVTAAGELPEGRRALLLALAAKALGLDPSRVEVEHRAGAPPRVVRPAGSGLFLSSASRGRFAAVAAGRSPIGVDVEVIDADGEIPWGVLHPDETAFLQDLAGHGQALGFCRLWSLKEAYAKALGLGLRREPSSFAVTFVGTERACVADPLRDGPVEARTHWRRLGQDEAAVSAVVLAGAVGEALPLP